MALYSFQIEEPFSGTQEFMIEADSLIDAHMKALDYAKLLNEKIQARFDVCINCEITFVSKVDAKRADDAGADEYLDEIATYFACD